ncbi:MAG: discoidin domain-containing protein [Akkermansiaceae bacterium]|nr:discoidin domain-containing protein [Akkermansiaceae bacterium]MCP5546291.1 discoidin domain-containing protein [Akkermansiaceae bacterium]
MMHFPTSAACSGALQRALRCFPLVLLAVGMLKPLVPADELIHQIRILPLGDSITRGNNDINYPNGDIPGGYRKSLGVSLASIGPVCEFVGSRSDNAAPDMDADHEGHPGFRTDEILALTPAAISGLQPRAVLLMAGTNDILQRVPVPTAVANLDSLIVTITHADPDIRLFVATILPITQKWPPFGASVPAATLNADANTYNTQVRALVAQHANAGRKVTLVDINADIVLTDPQNPANNVFQPGDGIHPGQAGYDQLGSLWFQALAASDVFAADLPAAGAPAAPTGLAAAVVSPSRINLTWTDEAVDEDEYEIWSRVPPVGLWEMLGEVSADATGRAVTGLKTGSGTYAFAVRARNTLGFSAWSDIVETTPSDVAHLKSASASSTLSTETPPENANDGADHTHWVSEDGVTDPSANWTVDLGDPHHIQEFRLIARQDSDVPEHRREFEVRASNDPGFSTYEVIGAQGSSPLAHASVYQVEVSDEVPYRYIRVAKTEEQGMSMALVEVMGVDQVAAPQPPAGLVATAVDSGHVCLEWQVVSDNESGFLIERRVTGGTFGEIAMIAAESTSFSDHGLDPEADYEYRVSAVNEAGPSTPAPVAAVTTGDTAAYDQWSQSHPVFAALPAGEREPLADANGDGVPNLICYALASDPMAQPAGLPAMAGGPAAGGVVFRFRRNQIAPDLIYQVLRCDDPSGGWDAVDLVSATVEEIPGESGVEMVSLPVPTTDHRMFYRLRITRVPD